jgi:hypothetical protein
VCEQQEEEQDELPRQPFHVKTLAWQVRKKCVFGGVLYSVSFILIYVCMQLKRFHTLMEPLIVIDAILDALKDWDMPYVSAFTCVLLLNMCYQDTLVYVPALTGRRVCVRCVVVVTYMNSFFPPLTLTHTHSHTHTHSLTHTHSHTHAYTQSSS